MILFFLVIMISITVFVFIKYSGSAVPVLLYHQVNNKSIVRPGKFETHLKVLKLLGMKPITLYEAGKTLKAGLPLPKRTVIITFDDGYFDNYFYVLPILKKYRMPITLFLNTGYILDRPRGNDFPEIKNASQANAEAAAYFYSYGNAGTLQYMTWDEVKVLNASGLVDIQLHTPLHKPVFSELKLEKIVNSKNIDRSVIFLYNNKAEEGYPIFSKMGETAARKISVTDRFVNDFRYYYFKNLMGGVPLDEQIKQGQQFIDAYLGSNPDSFSIETEEECENRIREVISLNKKEILDKLNKKTEYFAWPWGDKSDITLEMIKKEGVIGFATCIDGTNSRKVNLNLIKRVEIKKQGLLSFMVLILILNNIVFGTIYEYVRKGIDSYKRRKK